MADALAAKLALIVPRAADDEQALLAPFADPRVAERISQQIDAGLETPGARDVTASYREGPRLVTLDGCTYLQPTVVLCDSPDHPLANREFLFPFAAVVKVTPERCRAMPEPMGKTLVVTALTRDRALLDRLLASPLVDRLNVGPIATNQISWDQPHEGNLFEHLYARRSFQAAEPLRGQRPGPPSREDPVADGRRRQHVLRQLPARQRARGRAPRARPRRRSHAGLHADPHRRAERQPAVTCSSAASASSSSSTRRSSATRRDLLDRLWDADWVIRMATKRQIKVDPKSLGELTVSMLRGEHGFQRKEIDKMLDWLATERPLRRRQPAVHAAARPGGAAAARARASRSAARCRARICFSTGSASRTASSRSI